MLFITGLLTLLAIAQAGGDHIKGGSITQLKVAQGDIIPSPFAVKSAASPFGSKVIQQEAASEPLSKTARGTVLHHAVKTAAATPSKTQLSPVLHHAASSPIIQDQLSIEDPAPGSTKTVKTVSSLRDPIAQTTKNVQDSFSGTKQIKIVKMIDPVKPSFSQEDRQVRDPIARPVIQTVKVAEDPALSTQRIKTLATDPIESRFTQDTIAQPIIQTVKTSEEPSASVVAKTIKTTVKTAEPSNLRSKASFKTAQQNVDMLRISKTPLSIVEAAKRNTLTTSSASNAALLNSRREGIQTSGMSGGLLLNSLADSEIQPGSGLVNEVGEMILDEETLQTLQNAGGIINENGRIALNDEGIKILQSMRGGTLSTYSSRVSGTGLNIAQSGQPARADSIALTNPLVNSRSSSIRTSPAGFGTSADVSSGISRSAQNINAPAMRSQLRSPQRSQTGSIRSRVIGGSTTTIVGSSRSAVLPSTPISGARILSSNALPAQTAGGAISGGSVVSGTALFNGKEISIEGLKEGQIFDENLRPILSDIGNIEAPVNVVSQPRIRAPQNVPAGALRTSAINSVIRTTEGTSRSSGVSALRSTPNIRAGSLGATISTSQRASQGPGITRTTGSLTSGTALFNGKEVTLDGFKEGQLFDENLRPLTPGAPVFSSGQTGDVPLGNVAPRPRARPNVPLTSGLRSSAVTSTSSGQISRSRISSTLLTQSRPNVRAGPLTTTTSSGQQRTLAIGGRSGGSLTSGTVLFNGKEINVDGLKEGQLFDENLRPITPGASVSSSGQISGAPLRSAPSRPNIRAPQRSQTGLRSSTATSTSRGSVSRSRTSSTLLSQSTPNVRAGVLSIPISPGEARTQAIGGIRSGGSLTSGTALFNGKEISVDGLREGQFFDENLRPIAPGASISSSGPARGAPLRSGAPRSSVRTPQAGQAVLRSSTDTSASRGSISRSRTSSTLLSQSIPNLRAGPSSRPITSGEARTQTIGSVRSGGSLTSGTVLFNGKEISVEGLKEGQMFDENLRPIMPGPSISSTGQISGVPLRTTAPRPNAITPQISTGLRSSTVSSTSRGVVNRLRTTNTLVSQPAPAVRTGPVSAFPSSVQVGSQAMGGISSSGGLASGTALFNGREISVAGLKEGQLFDENLQPILSGISRTANERSAIVTSSEEISNIPFGNMAQIPESGLTQNGVLRTSIISGSSRGPSGTSSSLPSRPVLIGEDGSLTNAISYEAGLSQAGGTSRSGGSLTSGTALFNGQEIRIDGLKEGQIFDENLQPIMPGTPEIIAEKSSAFLSSGQIAGIPSRSVVAPKPISRSPQRIQTGTLRSSAITSTTGSSRSSSRRTGTLLTQAAPAIRAGPLGNVISSEAGRFQTIGGIRSGGSLTSGKVLFNGKEINIDGLKEGQIFDENLRPILSGSPGTTAQRPAVISSSDQVSSVPPRSAAPKPSLRGPQRIQTTNLRSSSVTGSSRGVIGNSRRTSTVSQLAPQRLQTGNFRSGTITTSSRGTVSSARRTTTLVSQPGLAIRAGQLSTTSFIGQGNAGIQGGAGSSGSLTSGTVLFNGKEINMDGLKEGQLFDENLQPITSGVTGFISEKSSAIPGVSPAAGISSIRTVQNEMLTSQRSQTGGVKPSVTGGLSRSTFSSTRTSSASMLGSTGNLGLAGTAANAPLTSGPQTNGIVRSGGAFASGTVLFDGKEIPIEGLEAGQIFDENLRPITPGTSGSRYGLNVIGSSQTSGASPGSIPKPRVTPSQRVGAAGLRTSAVRGSSRGTFTSSRIPGSQATAGISSGSLANTISSSGRSSQAVVGTRSQGTLTSGAALFNGKEIAIDGLKEGQIFDENLRPILPGNSETLAGRMSTTLQSSGQISNAPLGGTAPRPRSQVGSGAISTSRTLGSTLSQPATNLRGGTLGTSVSSRQRIYASTGAIRPAPGSVIFNGKEVSIEGMKPGQLYDENLRPITSGIQGTIAEKSATFPGSTQISNIPSQNVAPKPRMRATQRSPIGGLRTTTGSVISSSNIGGTSANARSSILPPRSVPFASGIGSGGSLASGTVLFNGKEISMDGITEGQLFDENLRPIGSVGSYAGEARISEGVSDVQRSSIRNLRTGTSSVISGLRSQSSASGAPAASGSLNYIDVTRTDDSLASHRSSSENIIGGGRMASAQRTSIGGASTYASRFGSKVSQDRITPEISQYGVDSPVQESILNLPGDPFKIASPMKAPSISRQTQIKVDDVLEQSSLSKLDSLRSVQESIPFSIPDSSRKIAQISQQDIDIPTVQQKLLSDFPGYLPKTSFLPPFNYAPPQLSASKYSVKSPMSQVQQKMEQVFV